MTKVHHDDTIAAIATPIGEGAIAVVRISGAQAISFADKVFRGKARLEVANGYTIHLGRLFDNTGTEIDEVLAAVFRNPHSYTGEDSVEISCHGGMFVTQRVLETILNTGVRQAEPGEFTKRAFLNGKIDLSQAEAVADIISARSERSYRVSLNQLEGRFSEEVKRIRAGLLELSSLLELELDFSEDGIELIERTEIVRRIESTSSNMLQMIDSYQKGKVFREGVSVAIVGEPNAGKSSLFNALLKENRAIVTEVPGTTRDHIEENITLEGILFRLTDTAGLRDTADVVEREGVKRAEEVVRHSDIVILVADTSGGIDRQRIIEFIQRRELPRKGIVAYNKRDLWEKKSFTAGEIQMGDRLFSEVAISAKTGDGLSDLRDIMIRSVISQESETVGMQVTNHRHKVALVKAVESLAAARASAEASMSDEFIATDIREAADRLAEITGEITTDDTLNNIFSSFCIGK